MLSVVLRIRARNVDPISEDVDATIAAVPVTCGAAIDVPCNQAYPPPRYAL